jgi:multidrug efflux pump subunit AcrA (membrane-fusion protein)
VIPGVAIGNDQQGDFVFVVGRDDVVERRGIVKGPLTENGLVVRSGLTPEDRVVVNGMLNARAGEKVVPQEAAAAPAAPLTPASARTAETGSR